jgi:hypothetical protein
MVEAALDISFAARFRKACFLGVILDFLMNQRTEVCCSAIAERVS